MKMYCNVDGTENLSEKLHLMHNPAFKDVMLMEYDGEHGEDGDDGED